MIFLKTEDEIELMRAANLLMKSPESSAAFVSICPA